MDASKPLKTQWFHILLALADEPRHGSGIMREVLEITGGELRLWPATLYGSLEDLLEVGWIELTEPPAGESERKRYYRITEVGRAALEQEADRLAALAEAARRRSAAGADRSAS